MKQIFYRQGKLFKIDLDQINEKAKQTDIINSLYAAVYEEFRGSVEKKEYKNLTNLERLNKLNEFALNWLKQKGFE